MSRSFYLNNIQMYIRNLESKRSLFIEMKLNTDNGFCVSGKKKKKDSICWSLQSKNFPLMFLAR